MFIPMLKAIFSIGVGTLWFQAYPDLQFCVVLSSILFMVLFIKTVEYTPKEEREAFKKKYMDLQKTKQKLELENKKELRDFLSKQEGKSANIKSAYKQFMSKEAA